MWFSAHPSDVPAARATVWRLRTRTLHFGPLPLVMGIVNVTPDSFSDGGKFLQPEFAVRQGLQLLDEGAEILDIGGESTRPYATEVSAEDELRRTIPVIAEICRRRPAAIVSIDTSKSRVASAAMEAGAELINDVTALTGDSAMIEVARESGAGVCAMHMQGTPRTMQDHPHYQNVVGEIHHYLDERRAALVLAGIDRARICLDPGIGFGKTHQHNLTLMANCWRFHDLGCPLLVGHSRKGFIGKLIGDSTADRTAGSIGAALALALQGVQIIRMHDVRAVREALLTFAACTGQANGSHGA
jgi:dihydropteroate synthase